MKLLDSLVGQLETMGELKRAWFTTFNLDIPFFETHVLPALLSLDLPANRMDYENMQMQLAERGIDVRVYCDLRMMEADQLKRTAIPIHGVLPERLGRNGFDNESLFHPKVIFLEDVKGRMVLGAGSANLSVSGWGRNQEVFTFRTVSNNSQYQQVKRFFGPLMEASGLDEAHFLGVRRSFDGGGHEWSFVHSFESEDFLSQLWGDLDITRLAAWSPYFSRDLGALVERMRGLAGRDVTFSIVPDLADNQRVRTEWSAKIEQLQSDGRLTFHDRPVPRDELMEMTHAKLWLASGRQSRLAVGSWNFTGRGCASFEVRNVEAGVLFEVPTETRIHGDPFSMGAENFSSERVLQDDDLDIKPYPLSFELQVSFDWERGCYKVEGQLHKPIGDVAYTLRLPGWGRSIPLVWKGRRQGEAWPLECIELQLADNEALLADHSYQVWQRGDMVFRGLIHETGQGHRRAQGYDSLKELLNDLVSGIEPGTSGTPRLRKTLRHDDVPEEEPVMPAIVANRGEISYFRLFHAFEQFRKRLRDVVSMAELRKMLFVYPGSLQEIVGKVNEQLATSPGATVFNWFLIQELKSLREAALDAYGRNRERYAPRNPPEDEKWKSLKPKKQNASLPAAIRGNATYMRELREVCRYER